MPCRLHAKSGLTVARTHDLQAADMNLLLYLTLTHTLMLACRTREKNRVAQRRFRDRQKEKDKEKERKMADMTRRLSELTHEKVRDGAGSRREASSSRGAPGYSRGRSMWQ